MFNKQHGYRKWLVWFGIISAIIGVFILVSSIGTNTNIDRYLPYGLLLLCPLSHLLMMGMHGHNELKTEDQKDKSCH